MSIYPNSLEKILSLSLLSIILAGCGGPEAIRDDKPQRLTKVALNESQKPVNSTNYHEILNNQNLNYIFDYGKIRNIDGLITVPLSPKNIKLDDNPGGIVKEYKLLEAMGINIANSISEKTGTPSSQVEVVVHEKKCEVRIRKGRAIQDCDRAYPFDISPSKTAYVEHIKIINNKKLSNRARKAKLDALQRKEVQSKEEPPKSHETILNIAAVEGFCKKSLQKELGKYELKLSNGCIVAPIRKANTTKFTFKNVVTKKFITEQDIEEFDIEVSYSRKPNSPAPKINLTSIRHQPSSVYQEIPKAYREEKNILKAEKILTELLIKHLEQSS